MPLSLKIALRRLVRHRAGTLVTVITFGTVSTVFALLLQVVDRVWWRPLPFQVPETLVAIDRPYPQLQLPIPLWASVPDYLYWRNHASAFTGLALARPAVLQVVEPGFVLRQPAFLISANLFDVLGVRPLVGRTITAGDDSAAGVAVIGERLWRTHFGADEQAVGRHLRLRSGANDSVDYTIVGVVPADVRLDYSGDESTAADLYVPLTDWPKDLRQRLYGGVFNRVYGRLKPGVALSNAQADMERACRAAMEEYPGDRRGSAVRVRPLAEQMLGGSRDAMLTLAGIAILLLGVGVANVAAFCVASLAGRVREVATAVALGASRSHLWTSFFIEAALVTGAGAALGLAAATLMTPAIAGLGRLVLPRLDVLETTSRTLLGLAIASVVAAAVIASVGAWFAERQVLVPRVRGRHRVQSAIVVVHVASITALGAGCLLFAGDVGKILRLDLGFDPAGLVLVRVILPPSVANDSVASADVERTALAAVAVRQDITGAAVASGFPFSYPAAQSSVRLESGAEALAMVTSATSGYLSALRLPLRSGRFINDRLGEPELAVNQAFVTKYFGGQDPIGASVVFDNRTWRIVGVVADTPELGDVQGGIRWSGLNLVRTPWIFVPRGPQSLDTTLIVRTNSAARDIGAGIRRAVRARVPDTDVEWRTYQELVDKSIAPSRFFATLFLITSLLAVLIGGIGIYSLALQCVQGMRRDLAIRSALGAPTSHLLFRAVHGIGLAVCAGVVLGVLTALGALSTLQHFLVAGTRSANTLAAASMAALTFCAAATALPALRASIRPPLSSLRSE
jgi:predicted permease